MPGLDDLGLILELMAPRLAEGEYVFTTFPGASLAELVHLGPVASVVEKEGVTLVLERQAALAEAVGRVEARVGSASGAGARDPETELALVAILRPLHRVLYTLLGPYHPDPAVSQGSLPGLNAMEMLVESDPSSDRYRFALTTLRRERARILEALDTALERSERLAGG